MDKAIVTGVVNAAAITIVVFAGRFLSPSDTELVKFLVAAWQVPIGSLMLYFAYKEKLIVEEKRIESEERQTRDYNAQLFEPKKK